MDKIKKYHQAMVSLLEDYQEYLKNTKTTTHQIVIDEKNHHYQLVAMGWEGQRYFFNVLFHFDIVEDKVWLRQNDTEWKIIDELVEKGVDKKDIIIGYVPASLRERIAVAYA
jgi:hypothetical protein